MQTHILFLLKISVLLIIISAGFLKSENPLCQRLSEHFILFARTTFAWFTSKDEVTNRLSANADYDVKLVESFAPPANWLPGSVINKDVYATNTGTIPAYVREKVTSKIAITTEDKITVANTNGKIDPANFPTNSLTETVLTLDEDERYSIEAGSFLAYAPTGSTNVVGRQVVVYKGEGETKYRLKASPYTVITAAEYDASTDSDKATKYEAFDASKSSDFQPTSEGLYVFRRVIDVANDRSELFEYVGYYYKDGKYYKVTDIAVTPDQDIDLADDGVATDGVITAATFNLAKDVKHVAVPTLTYDSENNRLVATYGETGATYKYGASDGSETDSLYGKAKALDEKEHTLAEARAKMDRAFLDLGVSNANVQKYQDQVNQLEAELDAVNAKIAELTAAKTPIDTQVTNLAQTDTSASNYAGSVAKAKADFENALKTLYGSGYTNAYSYTAPSADASGVTPATGSITFDENQAPFNAVNYSDHYTTPTSGSEVDSKYHAYLVAKKALDDAKTNYGDSMFNAYKNEMAAENLVSNGYITTAMTYDEAIAKLTFAQLSGFNPTTQYHDIHQKTVAYLEAKEAYEDAKTDANDKLADYLNKANRLGAAAGAASTTNDGGTQTIAGVTVTWNTTTVNSTTPGSGLYGEQADLAAQLATQNAKKTALEGKIATAISSRNDAVNPAAGSGYTITNTAQQEYDRLKGEYQTALENYYSALNAYNAYKTNLETQDKKLKIYINLSDDVVTAAGEAEKWQMLPVPADSATAFTENTAIFYYTSILEGGETSKKLIDSVELDKDTTNGMYKSFDFDFNVALDSAQITYSDDQQKTISTTAATDEFGKTPTLYEPTNINTAVAWPTT